jgi:hypothetical protein
MGDIDDFVPGSPWLLHDDVALGSPIPSPMDWPGPFGAYREVFQGDESPTIDPELLTRMPTDHYPEALRSYVSLSDASPGYEAPSFNTGFDSHDDLGHAVEQIHVDPSVHASPI